MTKLDHSCKNSFEASKVLYKYETLIILLAAFCSQVLYTHEERAHRLNGLRGQISHTLHISPLSLWDIL